MLKNDIQKLIEAAQRDLVIRKELWEAGDLDKPVYSDRMKQCHEENAALLESFLAQYGWPYPDEYGVETHEAAWLIAIHWISNPSFIKKIAESLKNAWIKGKLSGKYYAHFYDRIELYEGRYQRYGTHLFQSPNGWYAARLENQELVDVRRAELGMGSLQEWINEAEEGETGYKDIDTQEEEEQFDIWCKSIGWREGVW